jgi:hypothetical protein
VSKAVLTVLLLASWPFARGQAPPCYAGFEISEACISERGLDQKAAAYHHKIAEAMSTLGASYKMALRVVNNPVDEGYDATVGDVFTDVVRDDEMRNQSFIINVTADFLEKQPEILFEASSLHEVCHVMNDDLTGYHRNGANIEVAEEHCVLQVVGESRYEQYLRAYANYQHWNSSTYDSFLQRVKNVTPAPAPRETDEADRLAAEYFRNHADGHEHLLIYNGELHDVTLSSTRDQVRHDPDKTESRHQGRKADDFSSQPPGRKTAKRPCFPGTKTSASPASFRSWRMPRIRTSLWSLESCNSADRALSLLTDSREPRSRTSRKVRRNIEKPLLFTKTLRRSK